jgi:two-component system sensor kinase FixL
MIYREIDAALSKVMGDSIQVEQVLINLLRNSIDALRETRSLDGKIALRCRQSGEYVEICISDNGPGFSPELQSSAPQPFMTTKLNGLGFGLSFSRSIIEAHGGRLWVGPDRPGAAVYFTLPLAREASA